eukprot:1415838-Pleurochrysis_carterae.AAC.1
MRVLHAILGIAPPFHHLSVAEIDEQLLVRVLPPSRLTALASDERLGCCWASEASWPTTSPARSRCRSLS